MSDIFNREHEVINAGTFHDMKGENTMKETFRKADEVIEAGTFHDKRGDNKMTNMILIHKEAGTKKDAVRVRQ